jgi:hypothetical protein
MNVAIQTDEDLIIFYTSSLDRAKDVCEQANINFIDMHEVADDDMQFYCFTDRVYDTEVSEETKA